RAHRARAKPATLLARARRAHASSLQTTNLSVTTVQGRGPAVAAPGSSPKCNGAWFKSRAARGRPLPEQAGQGFAGSVVVADAVEARAEVVEPIERPS